MLPCGPVGPSTPSGPGEPAGPAESGQINELALGAFSANLLATYHACVYSV